MVNLKIGQAKNFFFDRAAITGAVDKATRRNLSKFGAFVWKRAKSSIRQPGKKQRNNVSDPGSPPYSHTGLLKKFIFFVYDPSARSVIIGPTLLNKTSLPTVPEVLEAGGDKTIMEHNKPRSAHYRPRPFMGPAFEAEKKNMDLWRDSVR